MTLAWCFGGFISEGQEYQGYCVAPTHQPDSWKSPLFDFTTTMKILGNHQISAEYESEVDALIVSTPEKDITLWGRDIPVSTGMMTVYPVYEVVPSWESTGIMMLSRPIVNNIPLAEWVKSNPVDILPPPNRDTVS